MTTRAITMSAIVLLAALGGFFAYSEYRNTGEHIAPAEQAPAAALGSAALIADSDRDGLKDWEEELWRTDPDHSDTDGDGVTDAEEIKNGRNPLIAGPGDMLDAVAAATKINPKAKTPTTDTERLARELFATYLSTRQEGLPLSQNEIANIIDTVSASVPEESPKIFTAKDIGVFADESASLLRAYGGALGAVLKKPWPGRENEITIFERAIQDENPETARLDLANLTPISLAYGAMGRDLARIRAPEGALASHLRAANAAMELSESVRGMGAAFDDPIKTVSSAARYFSAGPRLGDALTELRKYLENRGVSYAENENGYALWNATATN